MLRTRYQIQRMRRWLEHLEPGEITEEEISQWTQFISELLERVGALGRPPVDSALSSVDHRWNPGASSLVPHYTCEWCVYYKDECDATDPLAEPCIHVKVDRAKLSAVLRGEYVEGRALQARKLGEVRPEQRTKTGRYVMPAKPQYGLAWEKGQILCYPWVASFVKGYLQRFLTSQQCGCGSELAPYYSGDIPDRDNRANLDHHKVQFEAACSGCKKQYRLRKESFEQLRRHLRELRKAGAFYAEPPEGDRARDVVRDVIWRRFFHEGSRSSIQVFYRGISWHLVEQQVAHLNSQLEDRLQVEEPGKPISFIRHEEKIAIVYDRGSFLELKRGEVAEWLS